MAKFHHVALQVDDIAQAVDWYRQQFVCTVEHQDESRAMLGLESLKVALVLSGQHPPHRDDSTSPCTHGGNAQKIPDSPSLKAAA